MARVALGALLLTILAASCSCDPECKADERLEEDKCVLQRAPVLPLGSSTVTTTCTPQQRYCLDGRAAVCSADGQSARTTYCLGGTECHDGECASSCVAGESLGCASTDARALCAADGFTRSSSTCPASAPRCLGGACVPLPGCTPGVTTCVNDELSTCLADGQTVRTSSCALGCAGGQCRLPCRDADDDQVGCEFVVVKLDNIDRMLPFAITVSNATLVPAQVRVERAGGTVMVRRSVPPESLRLIELPTVSTIEASSRSRESVRVVSDTPITVHQFNPTNNVGAFSNDASLLLPVSVGGTEFLVVSWRARGVIGSWPGPRAVSYATVVATQAGTTVVDVTPASDTHAGGGMPAMSAGVTERFTLRQGEVLSFGSEDVTGTRVVSDQPIAVFAGNNCATVPESWLFCDHMEEQLLPVRLWGRESVVPKLAPRGTEPDVVRVIAAHDGTTLHTEPPVVGLDGVSLAAGQTADVEVTEDFVLTASHDVLVTQFMVGSAVGCPDACVVPRVACPNGPSGIGDPSQLQIISSAHFAREYLVLVPEDYRENHVSIAAPLAARVTLDGAPVMLEAIGNSAMGAARVEVSAGLHLATADVPFGMYVYGYDCDVSYAYPGGLR